MPKKSDVKEEENLFGTQPIEFGPTLSSGLPPYAHQLKVNNGDNVRFVPLHKVKQSMGLWVHKKQVKYDGGFKYVLSGKKLVDANGVATPVESPFDTDPNPEVNGIKPLRYMLVYVVSGTELLNGHVAYLELRQNLKKRDGTFDKMVLFEDESEKGTVKGMKCSLKRKGSGLTDTVYEFTISDPYNFQPEDTAVIEKESPEVIKYLKDLYVNKTWTPEEFQRIYREGLVNGVAPKAKVSVEPDPFDTTEIPF